LEEQGVSADAAVADVDAAIQQAILVGARDVLLEQLVDLAGAADAREALLQLAVSNLPVSPAGLAHMLADAEPTEAQVDTARAALDHLTTLSLAYRTGPEDAGADRDAAVHRWTAEGLARRSDEAELHTRSSRAGRYRMWRVKHDSKSIVDGMEAVRNFLAGQSYDDASREAIGIIQFFQRNNQTTMIALVAGEVLETLPAEQGDYGFLLDQEARAYLALGFSERAFEQYGRLLRLFQQRVTDYPDRADYQRDLSVSYNKVGDLYRALGQGEQARDAYQRSLDIAERLAKAEPDRADYQRDLSVSYTRLAQHHLSLDEPQEAFGYFVKDLQIAERLAQAEPGRADYQVDLAISLMQVAPFTDKRTELLTSALQILTTLQAEGRLDPSRAGMIERIQALLEGG
ncbi:MAG: tetratricopeptide repeat protein, partial [Bacteroidota bacterium]